MKNAYAKYIASLLIFGTNGIVASYIVLKSYEIVFLRTSIGSFFLILLFALSKQKVQGWKHKGHLLYLAVSGIAMGSSWIFLFEAYIKIGVSIATLAYYCGPVIVMVLSPVIFGEKMTGCKLLGFLAVIMGMLCLSGQALSEGKASWGLIYGLLSAVMYAVMVVFNKKAVSIRGLENSTVQLVASFLTVAVFMGLKQGFSISLTQENLIPVLILGVINTGLGCYLYFSSIGGLPVQTVSIFGYLEPLSALIFSSLILGERLDPVQWAGAALILGGAAFGEFFRPEKVALLRTKKA